MRVIVTRPKNEAHKWVEALSDAGYDAIALPLIGVLPAPDPSVVVEAWKRLHTFDAVMFVSGNAVDHFFGLKPALAPEFTAQGATKIRAFVTGPGSFSALKRAQVEPDRIDMPDREAGQFDSEALWQVVANQVQPGYRVLIVRGTGSAGATGVPAHELADGAGRDWFAEKVRAAGGVVEFVVSYQRRQPQLLAQEREMACKAATDDSVWLFSSSEAIANLLAACPDQDWAQAKAVVTHSRIAQAAREAGFCVVCESRPTLAALMASIESLG
ncbi:MAG: uroporphyrinogen-III synthase [Burkholderiales bacterium]